jgi:hypothetical protein
MGVENSYARLGTWFPLLGNNKMKLSYSENILMLAVQTAVRLHNFIMNTEQLSMQHMSLQRCISLNTISSINFMLQNTTSLVLIEKFSFN